MAIIIGREEVAIGRVAYHPHVDPVATANILLDYSRHGAVERAWRSPATRIADIRVCGIGRVVILVDEVPETLGSKVEDLGSGTVSSADGGLVEVVEAGGASLRPVGEVEVDEVVTGGLGCARKDVPVAVVKDYRWILDPSEFARISFRADQCAARAPVESTGKFGSERVGGRWCRVPSTFKEAV